MKSDDMEGLAQANSVLISLNMAVMKQLAQMTVTMKIMQTQLKTLLSAPKNQTRPNSKYYCCSCRLNYNHGSKT